MNLLMDQIKTDLENAINKKDVVYVYIGNSEAASKQNLEKGIIVLQPLNTTLTPVTTGILVEGVGNFKIIFAKSIQDEINTNAQRESGTEWLMRVMEGRNSDGTLQSNTGAYVVLSNLRKWGKLQNSVQINYDTNDILDTAGGVIQGNITIAQRDIFNQSLL